MSEDTIAELTQRLITLERRTAGELAAIRAELDALRGPVAVTAPAREPRDFSWLVGPRGFALAGASSRSSASPFSSRWPRAAAGSARRRAAGSAASSPSR
jgi:hypothetical protein